MSQRAPRDGQGRRVPDANGRDRRGLPDDFDGRPRPSGEFPPPGRRPGGPPDGLDGLRSGVLLRWLGTMSTRTAMLVLAGATLVGVVLTVIARSEPGNLLGFFVIVGSLAAVLGVRRGAVHLFFPMPALTFFVAALPAGAVHDRQLVSSTAGLAGTFPQWVAGIFWPAVVATILVLLVGSGRWLLKSPLVTGRSALPASRPAERDNARTSQGFRPPDGNWADDQFADDSAPRSRTGPTPRQQTGPTPRQGTGPTPRQQTGPTPRQGTGPTPRQQTGPTPRQGTGPTPRQGTGPTPRQGTGPTPRQGTGPTPRPGTGPTPRQPTSPTPQPGTGPTPRQPTGPTPRQGTGPAPQQGTGPAPQPGRAPWRGPANGSRPGRPGRDPRNDRDPWGDPRLPPDRSQPTGPRPQANGRPPSQPQPGAPGQGQAGPGPSFSPAPAPPRRQPPDGWTQRLTTTAQR